MKTKIKIKTKEEDINNKLTNYLQYKKDIKRYKKNIIIFSFLISFILLFINLLIGIFLLTVSILLPFILSLSFEDNQNYSKSEISFFNNKLKHDFKKLKNNQNFRNNQNYIINKSYIYKKLRRTSYPIDDLEDKYTNKLFFKILGGFISFIIGAFILADSSSQWSFIIGLIFLVILLYSIYNIFLFYRKTSYFYPRRKEYYTVLKYSPNYEKFNFFRKLK